jgi:hypothetical protein
MEATSQSSKQAVSASPNISIPRATSDSPSKLLRIESSLADTPLWRTVYKPPRRKSTVGAGNEDNVEINIDFNLEAQLENELQAELEAQFEDIATADISKENPRTKDRRPKCWYQSGNESRGLVTETQETQKQQELQAELEAQLSGNDTPKLADTDAGIFKDLHTLGEAELFKQDAEGYSSPTMRRIEAELEAELEAAALEAELEAALDAQIADVEVAGAKTRTGTKHL